MSFSERKQIDCDTTQETLSFFIGRNTVASVTAQLAGETAWSAAVLTLKWRLHPSDNWLSFSPSLTITLATPYQFPVDCFGFPWLGVQVSTVEAGVRLFVSVWAEGEA
jgi:hypothetical protein